MNVFLIYHNHYYRHDNLLDTVVGGGGRIFLQKCRKFFIFVGGKNVVNYGWEQEIRLFYKLPPR